MLVKALKTFAGKISMGVGEVREIFDTKLAKDLLRAGHVVEVKAQKAEPKPEPKPVAEPKQEQKTQTKAKATTKTTAKSYKK